MATSQTSNHSKGWLLGLGFLFIFLGCIGLGMVVGLTLASMLFFGVLLILAGLSNFVDAFRYKHWKGALWEMLIAILYIAGGCVVIYDPLFASALITMMLAAMFIVIGITRLMMAFLLKDMKGWGWMVIAGLAAIILGIMILMHWPMSALWVIGLLIAIEMIVTGWTYVFVAVSLPK